MVDINLLPEDLRKEEEKKKKEAEKKPKIFEMTMHQPEDNRQKGDSKGKLFTEAEKPEAFERIIPLSKQREAVFRELEKSERGTRSNYVIPKSYSHGNGISDHGGKTGEILILEKPASPLARPITPPARPPVSAQTPAHRKPPMLVQEVHLPGPKRKRRSFFEWLFSWFRRHKKPLEAKKIILEKPAPIDTSNIQTPPTPSKFSPPAPLVKTGVIPPPPPKQTPPKIVSGETVPIITPSVPPPPSPPSAPKKNDFHVSPSGISRKSEHEVETPVQTLEINLIPDTEKEGFDMNLTRRLALLAIAAFLSCMLVGITYGVVKFYELKIGQEIDIAQKDIDVMKQKITEYDKDREAVNMLITRLNFVENLLDHHVYWTQVFGKLEQYTVDDVFFNNFSATRLGDITLSAVGRDYNSVARQLVAFQQAKDFVTLVRIHSATAVTAAGGEGYTILNTLFEVYLKLVPDIFYRKIE